METKTTFLVKFRAYLLKGLLILFPVGTTFLIFYKIYEILTDLILVHIHSLLKILHIPKIPFLDIIILLGAIAFFGFIGGNILGRWLLEGITYLVSKLPIVRAVYAAIQQVMEAILNNDKKAFSKVALVQYPSPGIYSIGFISAEPQGAIRNAIGKDSYSVFIPTTPNPTSGMLVFIPKEHVVILDMSIDLGAKLIMSAGVISETKKKAF